MTFLLLLLAFCGATRGQPNGGSHHGRPEGRPNHSRPHHGNHGSNHGGHGSNHEGQGNRRPNGGGQNGRENWGIHDTYISERSTTTSTLESSQMLLREELEDSVHVEENRNLGSSNVESFTTSLPHSDETDGAFNTNPITQYGNEINAYTTNPPHLLDTKEEREHKSNYNSLHIAAIVLGCIAVAMCLVSIVAISFCEENSSNMELHGPVKELHLHQEAAKADVAVNDVKMQNVILEVDEEGAEELVA